MKFKWSLFLTLFVFLVSACASVSTPNASVIDAYATTVQQDKSDKVDRFTSFATDDYSDMGYAACTVDSQCTVENQKCLAGIVPNTQSEPGYCVPQQEPVSSLEQPKVSFVVTDMSLGDNAFDQWQCQKISRDGKKCLDGRNPPVVYTYPSIYGSPSPSIELNSYDLGETEKGKFGLTVERQKMVADYGSCIVAEVSYQEIWFAGRGQIFNSQLQITVCFDKGIWYFNQHIL